MRTENGCLILEPFDLEQIEDYVNKGLSVKEAFESYIFLAGIKPNDIFEIQAFAKNLTPYEHLIFSIIQLF